MTDPRSGWRWSAAARRGWRSAARSTGADRCGARRPRSTPIRARSGRPGRTTSTSPPRRRPRRGRGADVAVVTVGSTVASVTPVIEPLTAAGHRRHQPVRGAGVSVVRRPRRRRAPARHARATAPRCSAPVAIPASSWTRSRSRSRSRCRRSTTSRSSARPTSRRTARCWPSSASACRRRARARTCDDVVGHIGFRQSIAHLAHALGLQLDAIEVDAPEPVVVADTERRGAILRSRRAPWRRAPRRARRRGRAGDDLLRRRPSASWPTTSPCARRPLAASRATGARSSSSRARASKLGTRRSPCC